MNINKTIGVIFLLAFISNCTTLGMRTIPFEELKAKYANEHSKFLTIEGTTVHYRDEGKGPVLVLLHGVCASLHTWDGWVNELKQHYRIIRLDNPGFGLTGPLADAKYTPENYVELFNKFVNVLGIKKFSIAASSLGGYISWNFCLKYPQYVEKLILIDSVGFKQNMPWLLKFAINPLIRPFSRRMIPKFFINMAVNQVYGDTTKITDDIRTRYFELAMREGNKSAWVDIFIQMKKYSQMETLHNGLKDIPCPVLIMWGTKDRWIPYEEIFPKWKKELPNAKFIVYEGVGHIPMEEIPVQSARDAHLFLTGKLTESKISSIHGK
ncbi:MAG: alpha/beta hydrolase [Spirochaetes bacterium]|nr:alpha/beta hydrolase [Spirochaetota bacterium]